MNTIYFQNIPTDLYVSMISTVSPSLPIERLNREDSDVKDTLKNWIQIARTSKWVFEQVMQKFYEHPVFTSLVSHAEADRRGDSCSLFRALRPTVDFVRAMSRPDSSVVFFRKNNTDLQEPIKSFFDIFWRVGFSRHVGNFTACYNIPTVVPQFLFETFMKKYLPGGTVSVCREEYRQLKKGEELEECLSAVNHVIRGDSVNEKRILRAIEYDYENFVRLPASLRSKREYILAVAGNCENIDELLRGNESWKFDKEFVLSVVEKNGLQLRIFSQFHDDKDVVLAAVKNDGAVLQHAHEELRRDSEVVFTAVQQNGYALEYAHEDLRKDPKIVLAAVRNVGFAIEYAHEDLKKDPVIVRAAVRQDGCALMYAHESLAKEQSVVLEMVQQNGTLLDRAREKFTRDPIIVCAAVRQHGLALKYAHPDLRKDLTIVLAAVRQNGLALQYADASLKSDPRIASKAVQEDERAFEYVHDDLKKDPMFSDLVAKRCTGTRVWEQ